MSRFIDVYKRQVRIESEFLNTENYNSILNARIAIKECPDIIGVHPGFAQAIPLAEAGYLAELTGQKCVAGISEGNLKIASVDNRIYGVPTDLSYICIFYNKAIFAEYGLSVPDTWEELSLIHI